MRKTLTPYGFSLNIQEHDDIEIALYHQSLLYCSEKHTHTHSQRKREERRESSFSWFIVETVVQPTSIPI
jgi:hypothetical protein